MEIIAGIALAGIVLFVGYNSMKNSHKIKKANDKMKFYESLYRKHLAGKAIMYKNDPDPTDELCPETEDGEIKEKQRTAK